MAEFGLQLVCRRLRGLQSALGSLPAGALGLTGRFGCLQPIEALGKRISSPLRPAADMHDGNLSVLDEAVTAMGSSRFRNTLPDLLRTAIRLRPRRTGERAAPQAERVPHPLFGRVEAFGVDRSRSRGSQGVLPK